MKLVQEFIKYSDFFSKWEKLKEAIVVFMNIIHTLNKLLTHKMSLVLTLLLDIDAYIQVNKCSKQFTYWFPKQHSSIKKIKMTLQCWEEIAMLNWDITLTSFWRYKTTLVH